MCGIAGIVGTAARNTSRIQTMLAAIHHRGPDDSGTYARQDVLLGHRRLSIIDLAGGHQPISSQSGRSWLVFNGEIYNYREKRAELQARGRRFLTSSDSEVVVQLYEEFGFNCLHHLRGMYAFSIWDEQNKLLFAARDHLGQKPLFYAHTGDTFLFASEIKALLAVDPSLVELDPQALDQYLNLRIIAPPLTMFRRIRKLPPAHYLTFSRTAGVTIQRYWDLEYEPKLTGTEDQLVDRLENEIIESLRYHMVSDVPVGAFLSGGLDSTLILAMLMKHVAHGPIKTFSIGLPYQQFNEAPYASMVARQYGTDHHQRILRPSIVRALPALVWHLDEPSDPLSVCTDLIAQMASEHVKVVIGGDGGDELFGGYDRYYGNHYADMYAKIPLTVRRHILGPLISRIPDGLWYKSKAHQLKWLHQLAFLEGGTRYAASLAYSYFSRRQRLELYGPNMSNSVELRDPEEAIRVPFNRAKASNLLDRMLYADTQVRLPDHPVMILDRMTMAHSLEARSPLMDHRLAEFAARLPVDLKVRGRSLRYIQMRLAERYLPQAVLKRPKQGFSSALPYMLKDEYRHLYGVLLHRSQLAKDGIFNQGAIDRLINEHQRQHADHASRLWLLINIEVWYRMHLKGCSISELEELIGSGSPQRQEAIEVCRPL